MPGHTRLHATMQRGRTFSPHRLESKAFGTLVDLCVSSRHLCCMHFSIYACHHDTCAGCRSRVSLGLQSVIPRLWNARSSAFQLSPPLVESSNRGLYHHGISQLSTNSQSLSLLVPQAWSLLLDPLALRDLVLSKALSWYCHWPW